MRAYASPMPVLSRRYWGQLLPPGVGTILGTSDASNALTLAKLRLEVMMKLAVVGE